MSYNAVLKVYNMNYKKLKILFFFSLYLLFIPSIFATTPLGIIVYLEGGVNLQRNSNSLELSGSDMGLELYEFDLIETDYDGFVEIELPGYSKRGTIIKVESDTAFYLTSENSADASKMNIYLIAGSLSFRVEELIGEEELQVETELAYISVQGTDFAVQRAIDGSILVSCVEGKVICRDDKKITRYALPGSVVEKRPGSVLSRVDIDVGYEKLYGEYWNNKREEIFKSGAETFIKAYSAQYNSYLPRFLDAYENLLSVKQTLEKYVSEETRTNKFSANLLAVKSETADKIFKMKSIMPLFENCFYAVQGLTKVS